MTQEPIDIELVGGARDGEQFTVLASDWLVIPRFVGGPSFTAELPGVDDGPAFERDVYRRDVISDRTHRWRFVLAGSRL